jgi:aldehyde:ferredoxin oxidoreductase
MYGYMGKVLRVDLTGEKITEEPLKEEIAKQYIGGAGLAAKIIYDEVGPDVDPL